MNNSNNISFYEQLMIECHKIGKSVNKIEAELGFPRNALHNYKSGGRPSAERLLELSNYFGVSPYLLLGDSSVIKSKRIINRIFEELNMEERLALTTLCNSWLMTIKFQDVKD